ncbi:MAG: hypothetical protein JSR66_27010 [Proteobacteria bacterium]|nr:hypothetical protein [Pseudomonadota bacterium]
MNTPTPTGEHPQQEPDDLRPRAILLCAAAVVGMVLAAALLAHLLTHGPNAAPPTRPASYLTSNPDADITKYQQEKRSQLEAPGWVDQDHFAHIPIEQAMRELAAGSSK